MRRRTWAGVTILLAAVVSAAPAAWPQDGTPVLDARREMRKLGNPWVGWDDSEKWLVAPEKTRVWTYNVYLGSPRDGWARLWFMDIKDAQVSSRSGAFSNSDIRVEIRNYSTSRVYFLGYNRRLVGDLNTISRAFNVLADAVRQEYGQSSEARFGAILEQYKDASSRPPVSESARRLMAQAQGAVRAGDFMDAAALLEQAVWLAPWWPAARYNLAVALGEMGDTFPAAIQMKRYLALNPDGPDNRAARDLMYEWERKNATSN